VACNLERSSASRRLDATPVGGAGGAPVGGAAGPWWWLTGVGRTRRSRPRVFMTFSPTALRQRGESILLNLGGRRATMAAGVGGAVFGEAPGAVDLASESG
jgi:hypothetical protein